jgi:hypothetical protein
MMLIGELILERLFALRARPVGGKLELRVDDLWFSDMGTPLAVYGGFLLRLQASLTVLADKRG